MTRLIIADDEKKIQESLSKYIKQFLPEFEICGCFYNGKDTLEYMMTHPDIDIILTDICMPQKNGLDVAREICNRFPHCVVIIISGYADFEYAQTAIKYNVFNYMLKPFDYSDLRQCLMEARELSSKRRKLHTVFSLHEETIELFFVNLVSGNFSTIEDLQAKFDELFLPFSLENSQGYWCKVTFDKSPATLIQHLDIDKIDVSLKNVLQLTLKDTHFFFVKKSVTNYYYIAIGDTFPTPNNSELITTYIEDLLGLQCSIDMYDRFYSLKDFIQDQKSISAISKNTTSLDVDLQIQYAIDYINANYQSDITRDSVAHKVFMSPSYFSLQFKKKTGISFIDYLTTVRMQNAIELLKSNKTITEIAAKVGYSHKNRFNVNFRHYTSYSPSEYRKKILSMEDVFDAE